MCEQAKIVTLLILSRRVIGWAKGWKYCRSSGLLIDSSKLLWLPNLVMIRSVLWFFNLSSCVVFTALNAVEITLRNDADTLGTIHRFLHRITVRSLFRTRLLSPNDPRAELTWDVVIVCDRFSTRYRQIWNRGKMCYWPFSIEIEWTEKLCQLM